MITLETLSMHLVTNFKTVRLRALQGTPSAFGRTYAEESKLSEADWAKRATTWNNGSSSVCFIAMDESEPCGMIAGYFDDHDLPRPNLASMWVAPAYRRAGLGFRLVKEIQRWAEVLGASELRLMVTSCNEEAISFYDRGGFTLTGKTQPHLNDPTLSEREMIKPLQNS